MAKRGSEAEDPSSIAPLSGALFTALAVVAAFVVGFDQPDTFDSPAAVVDYYTDGFEDISAGGVLRLFAGAVLLFFSAVLWARARAIDGGVGGISMAILIGATAGTTLMIAGAALDAAAALRVDAEGAIDPEAATVIWDASSVLGGLAAPICWGVALIATARLSFQAELLPRWLGLLTLVLGVALLIPQLSAVGFAVFTLWPLAAGVALYRAVLD